MPSTSVSRKHLVTKPRSANQSPLLRKAAGKPSLRHHGRQLAGGTKIPLKIVDNKYRAPIKVGADAVDVVVDTLHWDAWVRCEDQPSTNPTCPTTCPFSANVDDAGVCYQSTTQSVTVGDVTVPSMTVDTIYQSTEWGSSNEGGSTGGSFDSESSLVAVDNVIGLAPTTEDNARTSLFQQVSEFSLSLATSDPFLLLNGVDDAYVSSQGLTKHELLAADSYDWYVEPTALQFDEATPIKPCRYLTLYACAAALDSRFEDILMASDVFDSFSAKYLTSPACETTQDLTIECDASVSLPRITLGFSKSEFYLDPQDYTKPAKTTGKIQVLVGDAGMANTWVLGTAFLRKHYSHYDSATSKVALYCKEGSTCGASSLPILIAPSRSSSNGGGNYESGGDTSGSKSDNYYNDNQYDSYDSYDSSSRKKNKLGSYFGISGAVLLLCVLISILRCFCSKTPAEAAATEDESEKKKKDKLKISISGDEQEQTTAEYVEASTPRSDSTSDDE